MGPSELWLPWIVTRIAHHSFIVDFAACLSFSSLNLLAGFSMSKRRLFLAYYNMRLN